MSFHSCPSCKCAENEVARWQAQRRTGKRCWHVMYSNRPMHDGAPTFKSVGVPGYAYKTCVDCGEQPLNTSGDL